MFRRRRCESVLQRSSRFRSQCPQHIDSDLPAKRHIRDDFYLEIDAAKILAEHTDREKLDTAHQKDRKDHAGEARHVCGLWPNILKPKIRCARKNRRPHIAKMEELSPNQKTSRSWHEKLKIPSNARFISLLKE